VLKHLLARSFPAVTDGQLVFRYARLGDAEAFEELMRRHGPTVWGVCCRVLRRVQDAEDAFQATFLVLARKAGTLREPQRLSAWLHGVAHRTALCLRRKRRTTIPLDVAEGIAVPDSTAQEWQEYRGLLDDAIAQLPTNLRTAFLLCHAEGLTAALAARRMNIPEGTIVSRLHRARVLLKRYLARRGVTNAAGTMIATVALAVPEAAACQALRCILQSAPPNFVAVVAQGVMTTMIWTKLTTAALVLVGTLGVVGVGTGALWTRSAQDAAETQRDRQDSREHFEEKVLALTRLVEKLKRENDQKTVELQKLRQEMEATTKLLKVDLFGVATSKDTVLERAQRANEEATRREQERVEAKRQRDEDEREQKQRLLQQREAKLHKLTDARSRLENEVAKYHAQLQKVITENPLIDLDGFNPKRREAIQQYEQVNARLKLREKLLLEVEEQLLRVEIGLP